METLSLCSNRRDFDENIGKYLRMSEKARMMTIDEQLNSYRNMRKNIQIKTLLTGIS